MSEDTPPPIQTLECCANCKNYSGVVADLGICTAHERLALALWVCRDFQFNQSTNERTDMKWPWTKTPAPAAPGIQYNDERLRTARALGLEFGLTPNQVRFALNKANVQRFHGAWMHEDAQPILTTLKNGGEK